MADDIRNRSDKKHLGQECAADGCQKVAKVALMCWKHYYHSRKSLYSDPTFLMGKVEGKYVVDESTGCWPWIGLQHPDGYGHLSWYGMAHRATYVAFVGPIPEGLVIDHLCRNRICVNPAHLEPVTPLENVTRSERWRRTTTVCFNGHDLSVTAYPNGKCGVCSRAAVNQFRARKRAKANG